MLPYQHMDSTVEWHCIAAHPTRDLIFVSTGQWNREHLQIVQAFNSHGTQLFHIGESGYHPGQFREIRGLAIDTRRDLLLVADGGNHRIQAFHLNGIFEHQWATSPIPTAISYNDDTIFIGGPGTIETFTFCRKSKKRKLDHWIFLLPTTPKVE